MSDGDRKWESVATLYPFSPKLVPPTRTAFRSQVTSTLASIIGYHSANRASNRLCDDLVDIIAGYAVASDLWYALCTDDKIATAPDGAHSLMCLDETDRLPAIGCGRNARERRSWKRPLRELSSSWFVETVLIGQTVYILSTLDGRFYSVDVKRPELVLLPAPPFKTLWWPGVAASRNAVYVCGGENTRDACKYDITSRMWMPYESMPANISAHTLSVVPNASGRAIHAPVSGLGLALNSDDVLMVAGGQRGVELVDTKRCMYRSIHGDLQHWRYAPDLIHPRSFHSTAIWNGYLVVAGGSRSDVEALNLQSPDEGWFHVADLPNIDSDDSDAVIGPWRLFEANGALTAVPYTFDGKAFPEVVDVLTIDPGSRTVTRHPPISLNSTFFHADTLVAVPCHL